MLRPHQNFWLHKRKYVKIPQTFSSLQHRNFRLYFFTQLVSNSGNWLTNVALTLFVLKIVGTGVSVGVLVACQYGPILLLTAWGGAISDRVDKRKALLLTQSLEMLQSCALAVLAFSHNPSVRLIYVIALTGGVLLAFDNPLRRSFVSEMVGPNELSNAVVMYSTIVNFSRIVGPLIAGLLVSTVGFGWCFTVDAISYATVISGLLLMRRSELFLNERKGSKKGAIREAIRYIARNRAMQASFGMLALIGIFSYNFTVTFPLFTRDSLHRSTHVFTAIFSVYGVGSLISALLVAKRSLVRMQHITMGAAGLGASLIFLSLSPSLPVALIAALAVGMTSIIFTTSTTTYLQVNTDPEIRGRVLSLQMVMTVGTIPFGGPLMGWVADHHGGRAPLFIGGAAAVMAALIGRVFA